MRPEMKICGAFCFGEHALKPRDDTMEASEKNPVTGDRRKFNKIDRAKTGRAKGTPNKSTALLKDAILQAAEAAGHGEGIVGYLTLQAQENPAAFMTLLGKVLPLQVTGASGGPLQVIFETVYEDTTADSLVSKAAS